MMRRGVRAFGAITIIAIMGLVPWIVVAADAQVFGIVSTSNEFNLTSPSVDVSDLVLTALGPVDIGVTTTDVMEFTMDAATMSGMELDGVCHSSFAVEQSVAPPATAAFSGSVVVELTKLVFTLGGTTYTYTPAAPPPVGFSIASANLDDVSMTGVKIQASSVTLHQPSMKVIAC
jgi:hypothetical protein